MPTTTYDRSVGTHDFEMIDLKDAQQVQLMVNTNGKVWLNLNGKCLLRIGHAQEIEILDTRSKRA